MLWCAGGLRAYAHCVTGVLIVAVSGGAVRPKAVNVRRIQMWITVLAAVLILTHLAFPALGIDSTTSLLLGLIAVIWLLPYVKALELPWGAKLEFQDLQKVEQKAEQVGLLVEGPAHQAPRRLGFQEIASEDPNLAMAAMRIELEKRLTQLAMARGLARPSGGVHRLLNELNKAHVLTQAQSSVIADLVGTLNPAVHGAEVDNRAVAWVADVGPRLLESLDALIGNSGEHAVEQLATAKIPQ